MAFFILTMCGDASVYHLPNKGEYPVVPGLLTPIGNKLVFLINLVVMVLIEIV